jgi:glycosyltransferase involved in cell wall biosynthesis
MTKFDKAYVLYANEKYFDIVSMAAKSIREFSELPIIVYLINSDLKVDLENTLTVRWDYSLEEDEEMYEYSNSTFYINRSSSKLYNLVKERPQIVRDALVNYAKVVAYVDSDSIATPYIDRIFNLYPPNTSYPYFTEGIYDWMTIGNRGGADSREDLSTTLEHPACELFNINQYVRDKYRTTNLFVAGQNTTEWLEEWYWMCNHPKILKKPEWYAVYQEETIANILLWKYKQLNGLPYVYTNGDAGIVDEIYNKLGFTGYHQYVRHWFKIPNCKEDLLVFHGEKRIDIMQEMINKIKKYIPKQNNKKILFIAPHLSTGGMPQYLLEKIRTIKDQYDVYVVEYACVSGDYVVQRNTLKWILGDKFYTLEEDKYELLNIIDKIQPDVIHFEDVPESFMDDNELTVQIFGLKDRPYFITATTHSSLTVPSKLMFHPDKFILPSKWIQQKFSEELPQIPNDIWEYPIKDYYKDQKLAQEFLKLDPDKKHVLMVGLFTPGKNQGEIFKIAKQLPEIQFHFVGNQAPNFAEYWEPLMKNKPDNCIVWGERDDVHNFYQACDLFYFSSKFELMPLSIREALSYKLPCIFRRLPSYMDCYDNNPLVTYINDNLEKTKQIICSII